MKEMDFATIDYERKDRCGVSEVIYGAGKTAGQIIDISKAIISGGEKTVLVTRVDEEKSKAVIKALEVDNIQYDYEAISNTLVIGEYPENSGIGKVAVVTAGTSDQKVAKEAAVTLKALGNEVIEILP